MAKTKTLVKNAIVGGKKGKWVTMNGTHVFIAEGQTAQEAIANRGKPKKKTQAEINSKTSDIHNRIESPRVKAIKESRDLMKKAEKYTNPQAKAIAKRIAMEKLSKATWQTATDQYKKKVTVFDVTDNVARTDKGFYHTTKLFSRGQSLNSIFKKK